MTTSIRERCLAALHAALQAIDTIEDLDADRVERNRTEPVTCCPWLVQHDGGHRPRGRTTGSDEKTAEVILEAHVEAVSKEALTAAVDAFYVAVSNAVLLNPTLGGIAFDIQETGFDVDWEREAREPKAVLTFTYALDFEHASDRVTVA